MIIYWCLVFKFFVSLWIIYNLHIELTDHSLMLLKLLELYSVFFLYFLPRLSVNDTGLQMVSVAFTESWLSPQDLSSRSPIGL